MSHKVRIATTSLATLEDVSPPYNLRHPSSQENLERCLSLLDAAGKQNVDLVCLPESVLTAGMPYSGDAISKAAQPIPGPAFTAIAEYAEQYSMYVVAGLPMIQDGTIRNVAVMIDRRGHLVGTYAKIHPTEGEIMSGIVPGTEEAVFDTDFGRIGLAICFDLNWPDQWERMAKNGANIVCWLSAYLGGFPLQAYAWMHRFHVVSAVWPYESRVIDVTGKILNSTTRWSRLAVCEIDLDKRLFHTDGQSQFILPLQSKYGQRIKLESFTEEHIFTIESLDPNLSVDTIIAEFGLIEYENYINRCTEMQQQKCVRL